MQIGLLADVNDALELNFRECKPWAMAFGTCHMRRVAQTVCVKTILLFHLLVDVIVKFAFMLRDFFFKIV